MESRVIGYINPYYATKYRSLQSECSAIMRGDRHAIQYQLQMDGLFDSALAPKEPKQKKGRKRRGTYTPPPNWASYSPDGSPPTVVEEERRRQEKTSLEAQTSNEAESETHH